MKKCCLACLALLLPLLMEAQDLAYYLPRTTVVVEVDAVQEYHFAGPYAAFARRLLGIEVPLQDQVSSRIVEVRLTPVVEADPDTSFTCPSSQSQQDLLLSLSSQGLVAFATEEELQNLVWRFWEPQKADFYAQGITAGQKAQTYYTYTDVRRDSSVTIKTPVQQVRMVDKTLEDKAAEAAELILTARKERLNISTGNTDASFNGEALGAALGELDRVEQEYLRLFTGESRSVKVSAAFEVTPDASNRGQIYPVFVLTDAEGPVKEGSGTLYSLQCTGMPAAPAEEAPARRRLGRKAVVHYREPAVCTLRLLEENRPLLETRMAVYQLGRERTMQVK